MSTSNPPKDKITTIVSVCSSYPRYEGDSAAIFLRTLNKSFDKNKYRLIVLAPDHQLVENNIRDPGINIVYFRYFFRRYQGLTYGSGVLPNLKISPIKILLVPFYIASMFAYLCKILWTEEPKLIHAHWVLPQGVLCVLAGKLCSTPVIITTHGGDAFALKGWFASVLKRISLRGCAAWTANTNITAKATDPGEKFVKKMHIIPMGIDTNTFTRRADAHHEAREGTKYILLFVGRLVPKKGVSVLLRAFHLLPNNIKNNCMLWIVGEGIERQSLEKQARSLKLSGYVQFFGEVPNTDLRHFFQRANLLIVPSVVDEHGDTEGQGVVILEAMASETPVVASSVGGIENVIEDGVSGYLFRPGDAFDLARTIERIVASQTTAVTNKALNVVKNKYDIKIVEYQFVSLYKHVLDRSV